jgi:hypothetical protein
MIWDSNRDNPQSCNHQPRRHSRQQCIILKNCQLDSQPGQGLHLDRPPNTKTHVERCPASPRSTGRTQTVNKVFEGSKTAKDSLFWNWLRAAFVAKDLDNNADSTSQLQIEPEFPATFTAEQLATFYTDLAIGFDEENHTFGTTIANGILNVLHPTFVPPPEPEVIDVDNDRNVRQRAAPDTTNDALLQRILQLEETW